MTLYLILRSIPGTFDRPSGLHFWLGLVHTLNKGYFQSSNTTIYKLVLVKLISSLVDAKNAKGPSCTKPFVFLSRHAIYPFLGSCPVGKAWVDFPSTTDTAHADGTECSNMGNCNRVTGVCECRTGFGGQACDRCEQLHSSSTEDFLLHIHDEYVASRASW